MMLNYGLIFRRFICVMCIVPAVSYGATERVATAYTDANGFLTSIQSWDGYEPIIGLNFYQKIDYCQAKKIHFLIEKEVPWGFQDIRVECFDVDGKIIINAPLVLSIESLSNEIDSDNNAIVIPHNFTEPYVRLWVESIYENLNGIRYSFPLIISFY